MTEKTDAKRDQPSHDYHPHLSDGRSRSAVLGVMWSALHTLIPTVSSAMVFFISASYLSPTDFGLVSLANSLVFFVIAVSPLAFGEALVQRQSLSKDHADSVFWMTAVFGLVYIIPFLISARWIANLMGEPAIAALLPVLALRIPLDFAAVVPNAIIVRSMKFKLVALRTSVATMVSVIISLSMLVAGYGLWALVISQITASFVICAMAFWASGWRPGFSFKKSAFKDLIQYGLFASGNHMLVTMKLDHIVLGTLGGPHMLGLYFFAQRFFWMLVELVSGALSSVSHALLSTLQGDKAKMVEAFGIASFSAAAMSTPMFVLLAIVAPDLLSLLLDPKWDEATIAVQIFCAVGILEGIAVVQGALIRSQGKAHWLFYYQLGQQIGMVLAIVIAYRFGLAALVTAIVVKTYFIWPISIVMTARILEQSVWTYLKGFLPPIVSATVMAAAVIGVSFLWPDMATVYRLPLQCLVAGVVYLPVLFLFSRRRILRIWQIVSSKGRKFV